MKITIRRKLILINLVIMLPILLVAGYSYYMMIQATRNEYSWQIRLIGEEISKDLAAHFEQTFDVIEALANNPLVTSMDPRKCDPLFARLMPSYPLHLNILAANSAGRNVGSAVDPVSAHKLDYLDKEWFQQAGQGKKYIGNLHISKLFKFPAIMLAGPVYGEGGRQVGVLGMPLNLDAIREKLLRDWRLPEESLIVIADASDKLLVDTLHKEHRYSDAAHFPLINKARATTNDFIEMPASDNINRLYFVTTPSGTNWRVIVGVPSVSLAANALLINGRYLAAFVLALVAGMLTSWLIWRGINDNIFRICNGISAIGSGQLEHRIKLAGHDELAEVEDAFNLMADEHQQYSENIREMNARLEKQVEERTAQLTRINKELDSFAYSVSHDLQGPIRRISGYCEIVHETNRESLNTEGVECLERIRRSCLTMTAMIEELLQFSHLSRADVNLQTVNLSEMAKAIADDLQSNEPQRQVAVRVEPEATAMVDPVLMYSVLANLIGNAWKFTRPIANPEITFGVVDEQGRKIYFVRDNGVGFDESYAERLFTPFQRLHSASEFEGSGIGLSTVERIMRRHGGTVWAESKGEGAIFYFSFSQPAGRAGPAGAAVFEPSDEES